MHIVMCVYVCVCTSPSPSPKPHLPLLRLPTLYERLISGSVPVYAHWRILEITGRHAQVRKEKEKRDTRLMGFWLMMERDQSSLMSEDSTLNEEQTQKSEI